MLYPVVVSLGMGGGIAAFIYKILYMIKLKVNAKLWCSVHLKYDDDTFKWVNRYMKDMGYIKKGSTNWVCKEKKEEEEGWWIEIFKNKDANSKPEV